MKKFKLQFDAMSEIDSRVLLHHDIIESNSLVEVVSRLLISIAQLQQKIIDEEQMKHYGINEDDIPF